LALVYLLAIKSQPEKEEVYVIIRLFTTAVFLWVKIRSNMSK